MDVREQVMNMSSCRFTGPLFSVLLLLAANCTAATYRLGVPPLMSEVESAQRYAPLLRYLSDKTGQHFELAMSTNFMGYWQSMRRGTAFDFLLDGSHLAAYRVDRRHHRFVARLEGVVSYSLVARGEDLIMEPEELLNRRIAILASPNMSALAMAKIYSNPSRQPKQVPMASAEAALDAVRNGVVDAAIVPTPFLPRYPGASVILTTEQMPGLTMTVAGSFRRSRDGWRPLDSWRGHGNLRPGFHHPAG